MPKHVTDVSVGNELQKLERVVSGQSIVVPPATAAAMRDVVKPWFGTNFSVGNMFHLDTPTAFQFASLLGNGTGSFEIGIYAMGRNLDGTWSSAKMATTGILDLATFTPDGQGTIRPFFQDYPVLAPGMYCVSLWCNNNTTANFVNTLDNGMKTAYAGFCSVSSSTGLPDLIASDSPSGRTNGISLIPVRTSDAGKATLLGDSITNSQTWFDYANILVDKKFTVVNRGNPGEKTDQILGRVSAVIADAPSLVHILAGTNDLGQGVAAATIIANLQAMIDQLLAGTSARINLSTIPSRGSVGGDSPVATMNATRATVNTWIRAYRDPRVTIVDWSKSLSTGDDNTYNPVMFSDHVHPNARGQRLMASFVAPTL